METDTEMLAGHGVAPKCLKAFYGARDASRDTEREIARKNTAKSVICPGDRPQEIYTPPVIIEAIGKMWPYIQLDPCSGPASVVAARETCYVSPSVVLTKTGKPKTVFAAGPGEVDGLTAPWVDYTYVNPPYSQLSKWLMKARHEGQDGIELLFLSPARGNRRWYRDVVATATKVVDLDPVKFCGFKSAFPQALVMLYWGANESLFKYAFEGLGDVR